MYDSEMAPRPEDRAPRWGQQPAPDAMRGHEQGRGLDWGAIMQRLQQRHQQRFPQWGGGQPQPPVGAPPAAPQAPQQAPQQAPMFDRERLMRAAQGFGRPQQPGGIVPPNWRGAQY